MLKQLIFFSYHIKTRATYAKAVTLPPCGSSYDCIFEGGSPDPEGMTFHLYS